MKVKHTFVIILTLRVVLAGCTSKKGQNKEQSERQSTEGDKQGLRISAAASLTEANKALGNEFKEGYLNVEIKFNYDGSGALRQQIEAGTPASVMMSANTKDIDLLKKKNKAHNTYSYAKNQLVLTGDKNKNCTSMKNLNQNDKLTLRQARIVPAGKYAKQCPDDQHLCSDVKGKIIFVKDTKQVLNYTKKGNAQEGFAYKINLYRQRKKANKAKVIEETKLSKPITCKAGATSDEKLVKEWINFLKSNKAKQIPKEYQFFV